MELFLAELPIFVGVLFSLMYTENLKFFSSEMKKRMIFKIPSWVFVCSLLLAMQSWDASNNTSKAWSTGSNTSRINTIVAILEQCLELRPSLYLFFSVKSFPLRRISIAEKLPAVILVWSEIQSEVLLLLAINDVIHAILSRGRGALQTSIASKTRLCLWHLLVIDFS